MYIYVYIYIWNTNSNMIIILISYTQSDVCACVRACEVGTSLCTVSYDISSIYFRNNTVPNRL